MQTEEKYWFPAKRYGWGWGVPNTWQGWAVLAAFGVLLLCGALLMPRLGPVLFVCYSAALSAALVGICWLKGEPPRWRWGSK